MSDPARALTTLVVGDRVLRISVDLSNAPESVVVDMELDYERSWLFETAGWQALAFGVHRDTIYWWSATDLVVLPLHDGDAAPAVVSAEDAIRLAFAVDSYWVLVCETSIRLVSIDRTISVLEFGEVLLAARWEGKRLRVRGDSEATFSVHVANDTLVLAEH